jgi:hypothetical protein
MNPILLLAALATGDNLIPTFPSPTEPALRLRKGRFQKSHVPNSKFMNDHGVVMDEWSTATVAGFIQSGAKHPVYEALVTTQPIIEWKASEPGGIPANKRVQLTYQVATRITGGGSASVTTHGGQVVNTAQAQNGAWTSHGPFTANAELDESNNGYWHAAPLTYVGRWKLRAENGARVEWKLTIVSASFR